MHKSACNICHATTKRVHSKLRTMQSSACGHYGKAWERHQSREADAGSTIPESDANAAPPIHHKHRRASSWDMFMQRSVALTWAVLLYSCVQLR